MMIALLAHALHDRAREVLRWDGGFEPKMTALRPASRTGDGADEPITVEFRAEVFGPTTRTFVITISEVRK